LCFSCFSNASGEGHSFGAYIESRSVRRHRSRHGAGDSASAAARFGVQPGINRFPSRAKHDDALLAAWKTSSDSCARGRGDVGILAATDPQADKVMALLANPPATASESAKERRELDRRELYVGDAGAGRAVGRGSLTSFDAAGRRRASLVRPPVPSTTNEM
jgi:hypothetical protein